jgi:hypothetical protein
MNKKILMLTLLVGCLLGSAQAQEIDYLNPAPFGEFDPKLSPPETLATGKWWETPTPNSRWVNAQKWVQSRDRTEVLAFALYTVDHSTLKLTAQCFPLLPKEPKTIDLELMIDGEWQLVASEPVQYPGWSAHFRIEDFNNDAGIPYRLKLGGLSSFEGSVRKDPTDKETLVIASMSCNSPNDKQLYTRTQLIENLKYHDPDLLFFAGDQNYTHEEATYGWLQFGVQFASIMKDRPTICIPDDHDVGQYNLWGANGKHASEGKSGSDGGFCYPPEFVNMVQRQQTWNLPDAFDPTPVQRGIGVYYTDLTLGGVSFAILEDRKFKSAPQGNIPEMGPRPDHINDPSYDRSAVDVPGLTLLGERQLEFLDHWARDWRKATVKVALSQTAFCGSVHLHESKGNRLLADLDCNGWPQSGRNRALEYLRSTKALHLCGDQHLATVVKHGIEKYRDGPYAFSGPALVNTVYGRWWWPEDEKTGGGNKIESALPWVGDYEDGLGNRITMLAYANPQTDSAKARVSKITSQNRGDGYALTRINTLSGDVVFECWPRYSDARKGDAEQYEGWPVRFNIAENDGRLAETYLPPVQLPVTDAVVALTNLDTGELIYSYRAKGDTFRAPIYDTRGTYQLKAGSEFPDTILITQNICDE